MKHYLLLGIVCVELLLSACKTEFKYQYTEGKIYGTTYHISYASSKDLQESIRKEIESVNSSLSMFNPKSIIAKINCNESDSTDLLFRKMFEIAEQVYKDTEGGYDITVAPLVNAWGFGTDKKTFPDSLRIDSLLLAVGMDKLGLVDSRLVKNIPHMKLDASSIAKGLGVDLVAELFDREGVEDYMVEIGGEVRVKGDSHKKRPWRIGIDRPKDDILVQSRSLEMILSLNSGALATSGNYRNFYMHEGKKYAHTISPKTGYPVQTEIVSASVYAPTCMEADAYATGFMVIGLEKSKQIIEHDLELEGCLIYTENGVLKVWKSDGLKDMVISENKVN